MTAPHRIRLQAAWDRTAGETAWLRSFGRPAGLGPGDRVWLVVERPAAGAVMLNGRDLPALAAEAATWRHDVTVDLRDRNALRLSFHGAGCDDDAETTRRPLPESLGLVLLEIESAG